MSSPKKLIIPTIVRISLGLVGLVSTALMLASLVGFFPNIHAEEQRRRREFCESVAISVSLMASRADSATMSEYLESLAKKQSDVLSLGLRRSDGTLVVSAGDHRTLWRGNESGLESQMWVQFYSQNQIWGALEVTFAPRNSFRLLSFVLQPELRHAGVTVILSLVGFYVYLRFVLRELDPARAVPRRVREALDTMAEGLLIMDCQERIVLANRSFERATGESLEDLLGKTVNSLPFTKSEDSSQTQHPWSEVLQSGGQVRGRLMGVARAGTKLQTFSVSASVIQDDSGQTKGVLASFEDVTQLEDKKRELAVMVDYLRASSEAIKQQNRELERLATRDPLTGCLNRRSFFEQFDSAWKPAARYDNPLSVMMVDVDFFKSINDTYGHSMGDEVLRQVAATLLSIARESDLVCRYGGEEFAILLPMTSADDAAMAGERIRSAIERIQLPGFSITTSVGVAARTQDVPQPQDLLDHADKCLYVAKQNGRNQVVRWDRVPADLVIDKKSIQRTKPEPESLSSSVPYHAVTALISALAFRDQATASHSRRVADLCVSVAEGLMSLSDRYTLEIAALLHDIGKVGVPDSILLKPGQLTREEWEVMRRNDANGKEIIRAAFGSPTLTSIIEFYQTHFNSPALQTSTGCHLPLGARILAIADAYDSMTSDRVYRKALSRQEALAELRRCAGTQFDPDLVERFIATVSCDHWSITSFPEGISKETALAIGLQIERLSEVVDKQDFESLDAITRRLELTAKKCSVEAIGAKAAELGSILEAEQDPHAILKTASELLDLCRSTQSAFVEA